MRDWWRSLGRLENALRLAAVLVLAVGLGASLWIWRVQDRIERANAGAQAGDADVLGSPLDSRKQLRDLELYGGKSAVFMEEAKGLFRGKALAKTVAVISLVTATGLFLVTVRWPD